MAKKGPAASANLSSPIRWCESLDSRVVGHAGGRWQLSVYSIVAEATQTWVQLALIGTPTYHVLLRMNRLADVADAIWALEQWLDAPHKRSDRIIEVCGRPARAGHARRIHNRSWDDIAVHLVGAVY